MDAPRRLRRFALLTLALVGATPSAQEWQWAQQGGGPGSDSGGDVAADAAGNAYATGNFNGTAQFGAFTLTSAGTGPLTDDAFVVKHAPTGEVLWARRGGGTAYDRGQGVAVDAAGNVYVTGGFQGTADFGPFTLTSAGFGDVFVAKYSPTGDVLWVQRGGGTGFDQGWDVGVDAAGNAYVAGNFNGTADFGPFTLTNVGQGDAFIVKYAPTGEVLWARSGGGPAVDEALAAAVDAAGNAYVAGSFNGTATFGAFTVASAGGGDLFVARYDPNGQALWARSGGGPDLDFGNGVAVDAAGNAYVTGLFAATAQFGAFTLTSAGPEHDVFVVKHAPTGEVLWARRGGGPGFDRGFGVAAEAGGDAYATGLFLGTATFGTATVTSAGAEDVFVVKYSAAGDVVWVQRAGGSLADVGADAATGGGGFVYVTGQFAGTAQFGPSTLTSAGDFDVFVAQLRGTPVAAEDVPAGAAGALVLSPLRPHPAAARASATLTAREAQRVRVEVLDLLGRRLGVAFEGALAAGAPQAVEVDVSALPPGVYLLRVTGAAAALTRKVVVAR